MKAVQQLLRAVRRRERLAEAARGLARWGLPAGLFIAALSLLAMRRLGAPPLLLWLTAAPVPVLLAWAFLRKRSWRATARRVDEHYGLNDRIGSALELASSRREHDDPRTAHIVDLLEAEAETLAAGLDPRPVVRLGVPGPRLLDGLAFGGLLTAALVPDPTARSADPKLTPLVAWADEESRSPSGVDLALAEPIRQDLRALVDGEDEVAALAQKMLEVLDALEAGEIDRAEAFSLLEQLEEQLADAEERFEATLEEDAGILSEALRELAEALEEHEVTADAGAALRREDADAVEKAFEETAERAEQAADGKHEQQALQKALDEAERRLSKAAQESRDTAKELDEQERRLRKEEKKEPKTAAEKEEQERRLDRMKRKVEELRRQHERELAAQRRLEQLRRDAQSAANRGSSPQERKRSLERLGRNAGEATRTAKGSRRMGQARDSLEEAKQIIRRAGKQDEASKRRQEQFRRFSDAAKGKKGQKGKDGKDGKDGKGKSTLLVEGQVGQGEPDMMVEMPGESGQGQGQGQEGDGQGDSDGDGDGQGQGNDGQGSSSSSMAGGDGIGEGSVDPLADPTGLRAREQNVHVQAKHGRGVSRAQVIRDSSQQGFASEPYRRVFDDYRNFAQSALDSEELPPSRRRAVKRYYQIISPRD